MIDELSECKNFIQHNQNNNNNNNNGLLAFQK